MWAAKAKNYCRQLRDRILRLLADSFTPRPALDTKPHRKLPAMPATTGAAWQGRTCNIPVKIPAAQSRFADAGQYPGNRRAKTLRLRTTAKAERLRNIRPDLSIIERCSRYKRSFANVAACIVIAFLMKSSAFSSAQMFESKGQKAMEHYYASNAGEDIARDIFTTNA